MEMKIQNYTGVREQSLKFINSQDRAILFSFFLIIYLISIAGNVTAIAVTIKRKHRPIQKTLIISLAVGDLFTATTYAVLNLDSLSRPLINWTMGSFMCSSIPFCQVFGSLCSSMILVGIALDRYRNVVHATRSKLDPPWWLCLLGMAIVVVLCSVLSFPRFVLFSLHKVLVIFFDQPGRLPLSKEEMFLCVSVHKQKLLIHNLILLVIIFLPLLSVFIWFYCKVAILVWKHRKPFPTKYNQTKSTTTSTSLEISCNHTMKNETPKNIDQPKLSNTAKKTKNPHLERKLRTFKIIIFLIIMFIVCRLPIWAFDTVKLLKSLTGYEHWILRYTFSILNLSNCALNPFLYTFLNPTLKIWLRIVKNFKEFFCDICCYCFNGSDFDDLEHPSFVENFENTIVRIPKVQFTQKRNFVSIFDDPNK